MLRSATKGILLIDHNKLGKVALHRLAALHHFHLVVVDSGAPADQVQQLREARVRVDVALVEQPSIRAGGEREH